MYINIAYSINLAGNKREPCLYIKYDTTVLMSMEKTNELYLRSIFKFTLANDIAKKHKNINDIIISSILRPALYPGIDIIFIFGESNNINNNKATNARINTSVPTNFSG